MRTLIITLCIAMGTFGFTANGCSECEGDTNCDGVVDGLDLANLASTFGSTGCGTCDDVLAEIQSLQTRIVELENLLQNITRVGNEIYIDGANLHIRNGTGATDGTPNELGNLIIGYNEIHGGVSQEDRTGSHNLVIGGYHSYSSFGGFVAGYNNNISGQYASVSGGWDNTAAGYISSVTGGFSNLASCDYASVSGGFYNWATGDYASVTGGTWNRATNDCSTVTGGSSNNANGFYSTVSGGSSRSASGNDDWKAGSLFEDF